MIDPLVERKIDELPGLDPVHGTHQLVSQLVVPAAIAAGIWTVHGLQGNSSTEPQAVLVASRSDDFPDCARGHCIGDRDGAVRSVCHPRSDKLKFPFLKDGPCLGPWMPHAPLNRCWRLLQGTLARIRNLADEYWLGSSHGWLLPCREERD